ncbi:hypothetical protein [Luteipulveratus flavus]|uniref:Fibronectin type-III domain-containing protein n=1 Tax=Luteipulveratus flavus TaxID=3031728 RepID=A0ABT6C747_9MICO|nr:hypothetical protein [Luteipulveratus sp. YIM 133296]MDF8264766.1 hypothetical protein [Luteipulveratus sp. YIM 133296]
MTVTYTASAGSSSAGTYDVWVRSRQAAAGSWRKELGHIEPGQSRTVRLSWPAQYADVAVYVGYQSEVDTSETVAYDAHPHFTTCGSAAPSTTGPSAPQTAEPPTPSPVTTALGVTG